MQYQFFKILHFYSQQNHKCKLFPECYKLFKSVTMSSINHSVLHCIILFFSIFSFLLLSEVLFCNFTLMLLQRQNQQVNESQTQHKRALWFSYFEIIHVYELISSILHHFHAFILSFQLLPQRFHSLLLCGCWAYCKCDLLMNKLQYDLRR